MVSKRDVTVLDVVGYGGMRKARDKCEARLPSSASTELPGIVRGVWCTVNLTYKTMPEILILTVIWVDAKE